MSEITDEEIGAVFDIKVAPMLRGVPDDVVDRQRDQYIADVRANPEALEEIRKMRRRG